ncbi:hypothetical protein ACFL1Z_04465 [Thermodesulfobacteriota bacterium]
MRKTECTYIVFLLIVISMVTCSGCASGKRGKLVREGSSAVTVDQLVADWQDYNVYWYGTNFSWVRGILFDPKDDEMVLTAEKWERIDDEETFNKIMTQDLNIRQRTGRFYRVLGPEDQFFGYLVVTRDHPSPITQMIDEKTLNVWPIHQAPRDAW